MANGKICSQTAMGMVGNIGGNRIKIYKNTNPIQAEAFDTQ